MGKLIVFILLIIIAIIIASYMTTKLII